MIGRVIIFTVVLQLFRASGAVTETTTPTQVWSIKCEGSTFHLERWVVVETTVTTTEPGVTISYPGGAITFPPVELTLVNFKSAQLHDVADTGVPCNPDDPSSTGTLPNVMRELNKYNGVPTTANTGTPFLLPFAQPARPSAAMAMRARPPHAHASAPSGSTAFVETLPYRSFALPLLILGSAPSTIAAQCNSQVKPTAFAVDHVDGFVTRNNMCTGAILATINVADGPLQVGVTPDGKWGIVTSYYNAISFINTDTNMVDNVIMTDDNTNPAGLAISPDGAYALVTNFNNVNSSILVVDLQKQAITSSIPLPLAFPQSVFLNRDATLAWVTFPYSNVVEVVDLLTGDLVSSISVPEPSDMTFNATGTVAYISSLGSGAVLAVDTKTYSVIATVPTGAGAGSLLLSPDGRLLTVNNYSANSVTLIDTLSLTAVTTIPAGNQPLGAALVPIQ